MGMREKLMKLIASKHELLLNLNTNIPNLFKLAEHLVENDVVPVVRCKDCVHCAVASWGERYCARSRFVTLDDLEDDDYCSYGERKDNDST